MREHQVVITGMGCISPRGDWTLRGGKSDAFPAREYSPNAGERIESFDLKDYAVSPKTFLDRASALSLAACALAMTDAKIAIPVGNSDDFGIALGTRFGCLDAMKTFYDNLAEKGARGASPLVFSHSYFNSPISLCAIEFNLGGYHATFCSGDDSGRQAVEAAFDAIVLGHARAMLCGAIETFSEAARVLAAPQEGEAAAFFVLEKAEDADARGVSGVSLDERVLASAKTDETFAHCGAARALLSLARNAAEQKLF